MTAKKLQWRFDCKVVEDNQHEVAKLDLRTVEELMRLMRYYTGRDMFTATYDTMYYSLVNFVEVTCSQFDTLSKLLFILTGVHMSVAHDRDCTLLYAIHYAMQNAIPLSKNNEIKIR